MVHIQKWEPPKKPARPGAYSEGEDEAPRLIEQEPVDVEREIPETDNKPVERIEKEDKSDSPVFEE
jgi:hypothetical protein